MTGKVSKDRESTRSTYPELERPRLVVIKQDLAIVSTLRQMKLEDVLASQRDMTPEFLPAVDANYKGLPQSLIDETRHEAGSFSLEGLNRPCLIGPSV
jgi:hypothetical protein